MQASLSQQILSSKYKRCVHTYGLAWLSLVWFGLAIADLFKRLMSRVKEIRNEMSNQQQSGRAQLQYSTKI